MVIYKKNRSPKSITLSFAGLRGQNLDPLAKQLSVTDT